VEVVRGGRARHTATARQPQQQQRLSVLAATAAATELAAATGSCGLPYHHHATMQPCHNTNTHLSGGGLAPAGRRALVGQSAAADALALAASGRGTNSAGVWWGCCSDSVHVQLPAGPPKRPQTRGQQQQPKPIVDESPPPVHAPHGARLSSETQGVTAALLPQLPKEGERGVARRFSAACPAGRRRTPRGFAACTSPAATAHPPGPCEGQPTAFHPHPRCWALQTTPQPPVSLSGTSGGPRSVLHG
jgi:hypothetical protein